MPHILIVEDEPSTSWALSEGLADDGFTIDTFGTAEDAWTWLQGSHSSDLVISDVQLPGMSGLDLARKIQRGPHAQPVILVTAYTPGPEDELERAGVVECFAKPFQIDQLRQSVHRALAQARPRRRTRRP